MVKKWLSIEYILTTFLSTFVDEHSIKKEIDWFNKTSLQTLFMSEHVKISETDCTTVTDDDNNVVVKSK